MIRDFKGILHQKVTKMSKQWVFGYKLGNYLEYFPHSYASYFMLVENDHQGISREFVLKAHSPFD